MAKLLTEGLLSQMNRVRDLITLYNRLPGGDGFITASHMKTDIQNAEEALSTGNVIQMLISFKTLKHCQLS